MFILWIESLVTDDNNGVIYLLALLLLVNVASWFMGYFVGRRHDRA